VAAGVFKAYDIRGVVPDELDADLARRVGRAFAVFTGAERIVVGRDMRPSGEELAAAFISGARSEGAAVVDVGLCSTDLLYFASGLLDAPGAMFTASHNPARYNGIKLCRAGARPVGQESGLREIAALAESVGGRPPAGPEGAYDRRDLLDDYARHCRRFLSGRPLRRLRVVCDTGNGMGGLVVPAVLGPLDLDVEILYGELDGTFPHHPADPIQPENTADLRRRVLEVGADVGLAFDGDADRVFVVDDRAEGLSGSLTTALVAAAMLARFPGATILHNLICSKAVPEVVRERGGVAVRTRVGHSFIKAVMEETGAVFGGEHSGHYYFRDNFRADSGLIAALVVLDILSEAEEPLSVLRRPFDRYADSGEINTEVPDPMATIEAVAEAFRTRGEIDRMDGLTVDCGEWWFNLRPSNTEPLLRLNLEAATPEECARRVAEVQAIVSAAAGV
jgi:phosphomannomutase